MTGIKSEISAARSVLNLYEEKYPGDKRPRLAIEAAEKYAAKAAKANADAADANADAKAAKKVAKACEAKAAKAEAKATNTIDRAKAYFKGADHE